MRTLELYNCQHNMKWQQMSFTKMQNLLLHSTQCDIAFYVLWHSNSFEMLLHLSVLLMKREISSMIEFMARVYFLFYGKESHDP